MAADTAELGKREWGLASPRLIRAKRRCFHSGPGAKFQLVQTHSESPKPEFECMTIRTTGIDPKGHTRTYRASFRFSASMAIKYSLSKANSAHLHAFKIKCTSKTC